MLKPLSILTENLSVLLLPSGNFSRFARIGIRTTRSFRLFVNINSRWMPSCAIVPIGKTAPCAVATAEFDSSLILAARAAVIFAAPLVAGSTTIASAPMSVAGSTTKPTRAEKTRNFSTASAARPGRKLKTLRRGTSTRRHFFRSNQRPKIVATHPV